MQKGTMIFLFIVSLVIVSLTIYFTPKYAGKDEEEGNVKVVNALKSLEIKGYEIEFEKNKLEYEIDRFEEYDPLEISAVAENSKSIVEVVGNSDKLEKDSVVQVKVSAKGGRETVYEIKINLTTNADVLGAGYCDETKDKTCIRDFEFEGDNKVYKLGMTYDKIKDNKPVGSVGITLNGKKLLSLKIDNESVFTNFNTMNDLIMFMHQNKKGERNNTLVVMRKSGTVLLNSNEMYSNKGMVVTSFAIEDDIIMIEGTRVTGKNKVVLNNIEYNICSVKSTTVVETKYALMYNRGSFGNPFVMDSSSAKEYISSNNIKC